MQITKINAVTRERLLYYPITRGARAPPLQPIIILMGGGGRADGPCGGGLLKLEH